MKPALKTLAFRSFALLIVLGAAWNAPAQDTKSPYPSMAPLEQYLMADRNAELSLARSAAPESISGNAEVLVLTPHGYETAVKGTNGFVCIVERSWSSGPDDSGFWNPKLRAPLCLNAPGARSQIPSTKIRTDLALAGQSKAQIFDALHAAIDKKELLPPEVGAMCYMMSKQGYLNDHDGHWRPHLMFFVPGTDAKLWGADLSGSPIFALEDLSERLTVFLVPVARWSDGTPASADAH